MLCGGPCNGTIAEGEPYLEIEIAGLPKRYRRCRHCAGEPVNLKAADADDNRRDRVAAAAMTAMQQLTGAFQPGLGLQERD